MKIIPAIVNGIEIYNSFHPLPEKPPLSQNIIWVTPEPEANSKNALIEEINALKAIPVKMILFDEIKFVYLYFMPFAAMNIKNVVNSAKINDTGVMMKNGIDVENKKIIIAPNPAPAEMPSNPGSARLFFNKDSKTIPEQESAAPTKRALRILGRRMSSIILLKVSLLPLKISSNAEMFIPVLLAASDNTNEIMSNKVSDVNIKFFFLFK